MLSSPFAQQTESKKEEFRKYLEKAGVMDALTKGVVQAFFGDIIFFVFQF